MEELAAAMLVLESLSGGNAGQDMLDPYGLRPKNYDYLDPYGVYDADPTRFKAQSQYAVKPNIPNKPGPVRQARQTLGTIGGATEAAAGLGEVAKARTAAIAKGARGASKLMGFSPSAAGNAGRVAMQALRHPAMQVGLKFAGPAAAAFAAGDLLLGDESLANKGMDAAMMTAGGALGSFVPVVGTALGVGLGKAASDGIQFIAGGGKSAEQRKMEEALALLQGRGIV